MTPYNGPMRATDSLAKKLALVLEPLQERVRTMHYRVVSSAFSPGPHMRALPLIDEWRWASLEEHLERFRPETVLLQLPLFWQLEPFVYRAARDAGAALCIVEPGNYPLDKAAMRFASVSTIIAEATEAAAIAGHVRAGQVGLLPHWILVHAADAMHWDTPDLLRGGVRVAAEVHIAPGVPLLMQCGHIVAAQSGHYHRCELFAWSGSLSSPAISTNSSFLFELKDFALPFALEDRGTCACGKRLVARTLQPQG